LRQRRKRFAAYSLFVILVSRPVRQALAVDATQSICRPFPISDAKGHAVIVAERFAAAKDVAFQLLIERALDKSAQRPLRLGSSRIGQCKSAARMPKPRTAANRPDQSRIV
jgi:hypothetical protein